MKKKIKNEILEKVSTELSDELITLNVSLLKVVDKEEYEDAALITEKIRLAIQNASKIFAELSEIELNKVVEFFGEQNEHIRTTLIKEKNKEESKLKKK